MIQKSEMKNGRARFSVVLIECELAMSVWFYSRRSPFQTFDNERLCFKDDEIDHKHWPNGGKSERVSYNGTGVSWLYNKPMDLL